ncbi:MAG: MMPL family transporter [Chthoniobacteraceae bacterium]
MILLRSPLRVLVIVALLLGGVWAGLTLRLETELLPLMPSKLPSVRGLEEFQRRFASEREVHVVADPAMPEPERAAAFRKLRPELAKLPGVAAVVAPGEEFGANFPELAAWAVGNLPPEKFAKALAALQPERAREKLAAIPDSLAGALDPEEMVRLQFDPLGILETLSEGGAGTEMTTGLAPMLSGEAPAFLTIRTTEPLLNFEDCIAMTDAVRAVVDKTLVGETRLKLTGRPAFTAEISRQMRSDMAFMMGVAAVLVCAMFWAFYRTLRPLGWILFFQFLALLAGVIVARIWFGSLNVISMGFASILLGVSMDYSILVYHHFASSHRDDMAIWARLRRGIWFSAATTAAAFLVLAFSSFPGLRQLSALVAAGLLMSALFATWLLRVVLSAKPPKAPPVLDRAAHGAADVVHRWRRALLVGATLLALLAGALLWQQPGSFYTAGMRQFQPAENDAYRAQEWLVKSNAGETDGIYLVRASSWEAVKGAATQLADKVSGGRMTTWTHLLPVPANQRANQQKWTAGTAEQLRAEFENAGLEAEWSEPTLRLVSALERSASGEADAFRGAAGLLKTLASEENGTVTAIVRLPDAGEKPVPEGGLQVKDAEVLPVSWVSMSEELTSLARDDMKRLGVWMLAAITILCSLAQRSARLVMLNFAALILALLSLALLLRLTGTTMSPLSLLSVPLLLGLVIDYSLHILMALEHSKGDLRQTYGHLAVPVLLTGLASCIGFGAPILTSQPALRNFGVVMDLGILSAVSTCLIVLPVLYIATQRAGRRRPLVEPESSEPASV